MDHHGGHTTCRNAMKDPPYARTQDLQTGLRFVRASWPDIDGNQFWNGRIQR